MMKRKLKQDSWRYLGPCVVLGLLLSLSGCGTGDGGSTLDAESAGTPLAQIEDQWQEQTDLVDQPGQTDEADRTVMDYQGPVTFIDDLGREVTVEQPERVAALIGSFADIWFLSGGDLVAAANDSWESLELDLGDDVVNLGSILTPDVEQLIAAEPDLVLASAETDGHVELMALLEQAGITVAYFSVSDFSEYLHMLDICTDITGRKDLYEQNGLAVQKQIEAVMERVDGSAPTVLFLRAASGNVKAKGSDGTVCGEMLAQLGCINIADSENSLLEDLSMEAIITADPEYIFVTTQGSDYEAAMKNVEDILISNPAWTSLSAVQNGNYYVLDKRLFNIKPNARWGEAYEILADILYPKEEP